MGSYDFDMDKITSLLGALDAQKLPSQIQTHDWIDWLVHQIDQLTATNVSGKSQLSSHGNKLAADLKALLLSHRDLSDHKNEDDILQHSIWSLSQSEVNVKTGGFLDLSVTKEEAVSDAQKLASALRNIFFIFWRHFTTFDQGSTDLPSLIRIVLADAAELVEHSAGTAKDSLRETEVQVQRGERDSLGWKPMDEDVAQDPRRRFEVGMDAAKSVGSQAIGVGKSVQQSVNNIGTQASKRFGDVLNHVLQATESDDTYRDTVSTIFDLTLKWLHKLSDIVDKGAMEDFVDDPTGNISAALSSLNSLLERLAGEKSTRELKQAFRVVVADVGKDPELRAFFDDVNEFVQCALHKPAYARSEEHAKNRVQLQERWQTLQGAGETRKQWHEDLDKLRSEAKDYLQHIEQDRDVQNLRKAYFTLVKDFGEAAATLGEAAGGEANWMWQDTIDVVLPKMLECLKSLPIPRMEFKDTDVQFVVEDLNISSFRVLPGHARVRTLTEVDISKESSDADTSTKIKSRTHIHLKGVQFNAKDVSFWYNDQSMKPVSEVSGLMTISVPKQGVDVDVVLGLIPQLDRKARDPSKHAFFRIDRVKVKLNNPEFTLSKTNHPILFTTFKPIFRNRLENTLEASFEQQVTTAIEFLDGLAYDIHARAGVFQDIGVTTSASYIGAVWSEIGHMKNLPGPLTGLRTTSVGIVRDDPRTETKFAVGARPQIIPEEKHGPEVAGSSSQERREETARLAEQVKESGVRVGESAGYGVRSFVDEVRIKCEREKGSEGWKSAAFDAPRD